MTGGCPNAHITEITDACTKELLVLGSKGPEVLIESQCAFEPHALPPGKNPKNSLVFSVQVMNRDLFSPYVDSN